MYLRTIIWTQFLEDRKNWKEKFTIINNLFRGNLLDVYLFNCCTRLSLCKAKRELRISDTRNEGGRRMCGDHTPSFMWLACSTDLLINPFTTKSVAVHKRPTAVKLMFISVFWVPYAPVTKMHLHLLTQESLRKLQQIVKNKYNSFPRWRLNTCELNINSFQSPTEKPSWIFLLNLVFVN